MLYKQLLKPVWVLESSYDPASENNIEVIQRFQNKMLWNIVNTTCYVRNSDLDRVLGV